tara:strand:+ start:28222 stop:29454 length:1233 start_codon:yes stop_codon:yes gene_type:complete
MPVTRPDPIIEFVRHRISEPAQFPVRQGLTQINNGSYGLTPQVVREAQMEFVRRLEGDPVRFFKADLEHYSDDTRKALAEFVNVQPTDLALVSNGTVAVATVLNNIELSPGDEILITDHEYAATLNELSKVCRTTGAVVTTAKIPFPQITPEQVVESIVAQITDRTKLIIVSHIASASALVMPAKEIVQLAKARGIDIFLDGAHTPGQIDLDIGDLDPTWYAASCHKWLACPKGSAFIYTSPNRQDGFKPMILSCREQDERHDRRAFLNDFDYVGTNDYTGNLVVPVAIAHMGAQLPGGWDQLRQRNHDLVIEGANLICDRLGIEQSVPHSLIGTMVGIPLPGVCQVNEPSMPGGVMGEALWDRLYLKQAIQVPIWELTGVHPKIMRISAQLYNTIADYERLADALIAEL